MFSFPHYPFNITFIFNKVNYSNMAIHTSCGNKNKHNYKGENQLVRIKRTLSISLNSILLSLLER